MANVSHPADLFQVEDLATGVGDLVAIRSRRLYLSPAQAIEMAELLKKHAQRILDRQAEESSRKLQFPENQTLVLSLGDSCEQGTPVGGNSPAGDTPERIAS
jgi:hypothetical protein